MRWKLTSKLNRLWWFSFSSSLVFNPVRDRAEQGVPLAPRYADQTREPESVPAHVTQDA